ncbi:GCN5-related N-acetyltransferase [Thalassoporum mexicanum PCC 7367]|uniref:GNAT family N-acetyltransferase n=1 Tax=Thalassoporum mexicanum TaxID=3457544 RepID=UPI00029FFCA2|nr:GNAT family N-acetyltransferase [Pseudanabaena sp. PCC 7367]AFY68541.1 GCN5-related N-acetyltransferase [Pseudanabaena sp. PCC 7367]
MSTFPSASINIRPAHYGDLETIERLQRDGQLNDFALPDHADFDRADDLFGLTKLTSWLPIPWQHMFRLHVAEQNGQVVGFIKVAPINSSHSTWQIERIATVASASMQKVGTQLIRCCLDSCWEARTWVAEADVNEKDAIALYRQNGFQPLAQLTEWEISAELLTELAQNQAALPNLMSVNNADASLLYQLDTASMPPQIRQVYDLGPNDFRQNLVEGLLDYAQQMLNTATEIKAYVYEPQRKAAIGYFLLQPGQANGNNGHKCQLTVHPAHTWLYPELITKVAQILTQQKIADSEEAIGLLVSSADYQPEREAYLEQVKAKPVRYSLMMARSVWHKVRETRSALDSFQLSQMLSGLQPNQKPVPGRIDMMPPNPPEDLG